MNESSLAADETNTAPNDDDSLLVDNAANASQNETASGGGEDANKMCEEGGEVGSSQCDSSLS